MQVEIAGRFVGNPRSSEIDPTRSGRIRFAQSESQITVDIELFGIAPHLGMVIAFSNDMSVAKDLLEEIETFGGRNPGHEKSVGALVKAVKRIESEFSGKTREMLLAEARKTFLAQVRTLETSGRTTAALEKLQANQKALVSALKKLAVLEEKRPEGTTLH
jgi:hypothetical protein